MRSVGASSWGSCNFFVAAKSTHSRNVGKWELGTRRVLGFDFDVLGDPAQSSSSHACARNANRGTGTPSMDRASILDFISHGRIFDRSLHSSWTMMYFKLRAQRSSALRRRLTQETGIVRNDLPFLSFLLRRRKHYDMSARSGRTVVLYFRVPAAYTSTIYICFPACCAFTSGTVGTFFILRRVTSSFCRYCCRVYSPVVVIL
jgi:hypothetical protein